MLHENQVIISEYDTGFGILILGDFNNNLCLCDWKYRKKRKEIDLRICNTLNATYSPGESPLLSKTKEQLAAYLNGTLKSFDLPLLPVGSPFQKKVWDELLAIPYGKTKTYLQLSKDLGDEKAIRAVAAANGANALSIVIPCHRILAVGGKLRGYAGGLQAKKKLLTIENEALFTRELDLFS